MTRAVVGRVMIPASIPAFSAGTLHVSLEDVSYADRAAVIVAHQTIHGVAHAPRTRETGASEATVVSFVLQPTHAIDPSSDYSVRARLDVPARAGQDAVVMESDRSYPVLTRGYGTDVSLRLEAAGHQDQGAR